MLPIILQVRQDQGRVAAGENQFGLFVKNRAEMVYQTVQGGGGAVDCSGAEGRGGICAQW